MTRTTPAFPNTTLATPAASTTTPPPAWVAPASAALNKIDYTRPIRRGESPSQLLAAMAQSRTPDTSDEPDRVTRLTRISEGDPDVPARPIIPEDATDLDWLALSLPEEEDCLSAVPAMPTCLASTLDPATIAELIAEGDDPWAVDTRTGLYWPDPPFDPRQVLMLARLCAACGDAAGIERLVGDGAATVVVCADTIEAAALGEVIRKGLRAAPRETGASRKVPPLRPEVVTVTNGIRLADQEKIRQALASPRPLVMLMVNTDQQGTNLPPFPVVELAPVDTEMVLFVLREVLSATGRISEAAVRAALPSTQLLAAMSVDTLMLGLRAEGPIRAARRIAELATPPAGSLGVSEGPTLAELPGLGAARQELDRVTQSFAAYRAGDLPWSDVPNGLLLAGPPGTGKTTVAAAFARSAGLPLIAATLGKWQERDEGGSKVTARMAATFAAARDMAKRKGGAVVFIDEIDSFVSRSKPHDHNSSYFDSVLNVLLAQLDGDEGRKGVIVIGATNHADKLDTALVRPGRLGTRIILPTPSTTEMADVIRYHLRDDLADADLGTVARRAAGFSMSEIEHLVQTARGLARTEDRPMVEDDLHSTLDLTHPPVAAKLRRCIAIHEAGHAVAAHMTGAARPESLHLSGPQGEVRMTWHQDARTRADITAELVVLLAGRAAEEVLLDTPSGRSGGDAGSDRARATRLAISEILTSSQGGDLVWSSPEGDPAVLFARHPGLRDRVARRLKGAYARALRLVSDHRDAVAALASDLLVDGTVTGEALTDLLRYCTLPDEDDDSGKGSIWPGM